MISLRLKIFIGLLISPLILLVFLKAVDAACRVNSMYIQNYTRNAGAVCRPRGQARDLNSDGVLDAYLLWFVHNDPAVHPGCDHGYVFNFGQERLEKYQGIYNGPTVGSWELDSYNSPNFTPNYPYFRRSGRDSRINPYAAAPYTYRNLTANASLIAWLPTTSRVYYSGNFEDGGDAWPNDTSKPNPGSASNQDGNLEIYISITCTCTAVPPLTITSTNPINNATNVVLNQPSNSKQITFTDTGGWGSANCATYYTTQIWENQSGNYVLHSNHNIANNTALNFTPVNLKPGTTYRWQVTKRSVAGSPNSALSAFYFFTTEIIEEYPLVTLDGPASSTNIQNVNSATEALQLAISTGGTSSVRVLNMNDIPFYTNTLGIIGSNQRYSGVSKLNAFLHNYSDDNPDTHSTLGIYDFLLQRVNKKNGPSGRPLVDHLNTTRANSVQRGTVLTGTISASTFANGSYDTSASAIALIYGNPIYPATLTNQDVILSSIICQDNIANFITGDLIVHPNMINSRTNRLAKCMYIIKGDLIIEPGVNATTTTSDYDIIEGFFIVEGETYVKADTGADGLFINGGLITSQIVNLNTSGTPISGTTGLNRDLTTVQKPSHIIKYDSGYAVLFRDLFGTREYSLREL